MRIVSRTEFMKMPRLTVFSKSDGTDKALIGDICVKLKNFGKNDFYFICINDIRTRSNDCDFISAMMRMMSNPDVEYPGFLCEDRDGMYENDCKFVIYNKFEITQIIKLLTKCVGKMDDSEFEELESDESEEI